MKLSKYKFIKYCNLIVEIGNELDKAVEDQCFDKYPKEARRRRIFFLVREKIFSREGYISPS